MTSNGWDIAMQHIDLQFDLPQHVASSLVRRIAANDFRLPAADRVKFQPIPDDVISRIERIVADAYLAAGENVGGEHLRGHLWQQALFGRHQMVARGELLTPGDFKARTGVSDEHLSELIADGSVFTVEVDEVPYIPSLLADPAYHRQRLQKICRIIAVSSALSRLDFLDSKQASLDERRPVDMLSDDKDFKRVKQAAAVWAAESSRTIVNVFEGKHETEPRDADPLYTAVAEVDPRRRLWDRASDALCNRGHRSPVTVIEKARAFTIFVERRTAGESMARPEACVQIDVDDECTQIHVVAASVTSFGVKTVAVNTRDTLTEVAERVVACLRDA